MSTEYDLVESTNGSRLLICEQSGHLTLCVDPSESEIDELSIDLVRATPEEIVDIACKMIWAAAVNSGDPATGETPSPAFEKLVADKIGRLFK